MRSKTSFFNQTLYRKNLTRFWPLWVGASLAGSLFPLTLWMHYLRWGADGLPMENAMEAAGLYAGVVANFLPALSLLYALPCALAVWSYLNNARSVGLMHRLPIRREGLFVTNVLSGLTMMLIPYAVVGLLCVALNLAMGAMPWAMVGKTVLAVLGESLFYFATATLAAALTGNNFAMPVVYFLLHFLQPMVCALASQLQNSFYYGVVGTVNAAEWLCPTVCLMDQVRDEPIWTEVKTPQGYPDSVLTGVHLEGFYLVGLYALAGLAVLALAYWLYHRRSSERAGDVAAFGFLRPVYRLGGGLLAALGGGMILYYIFWEAFVGVGPSFNGVETLPLLLCMALAGLVAYYTISMVLEKSLRVFNRQNLPGLAVLLSLCVLVCLVYRFDLAGVETYVPKAEKVERITIYNEGDSYTLKAGEEDELIAETLALHEAMVGQLDEIKRDYIFEDEGQGLPVDQSSYVNLNYQLKNGKTVRRYYDLSLNVKDFLQPDTLEGKLDGLMNRPEMILKRLLAEDPQVTVEDAVLFSVEKNNGIGGRVELTASQAKRLHQAVAEDARAGHWGRKQWLDEDQLAELQRKKDLYAPEDLKAAEQLMSGKGEVFAKAQIRYQRVEDDGRNRNSYVDQLTILLRPEMSATIAALREMGVLDPEQLTLSLDQQEQTIGGNAVPGGPYFTPGGSAYPEEMQWEIYTRLQDTAQEYDGDPKRYRQRAAEILVDEYGMDMSDVLEMLDEAAEKAASAEGTGEDANSSRTPVASSIGVIGGEDGPTQVFVNAG